LAALVAKAGVTNNTESTTTLAAKQSEDFTFRAVLANMGILLVGC
jgi:hypothetical protein